MMQREEISPLGRNYGVDALRIVATFMVVILHVLGQGGVLDNTKELSMNYHCAWLLEIAAYAAVNCYALVSGYVGIQTKRKWTNIIMLWLQVAFYSCLLTVALDLVRSDAITTKDIVQSLLPVMHGRYWYFTAYVGMWLFIPAMNAVVDALPKKEMLLTFLSIYFMVVFAKIAPESLLTDAFRLQGGYSVGWLMYLYMIGAWLNKHKFLQRISSMKWFLIYILCVMLTMGMKLCIVLLRGSSGNIVVSYISPTILLCAISLLGTFSNMSISKSQIALVRTVSSCSFGVYLIHVHPSVFQFVLGGWFSWLAVKHPAVLVGAVILFAATIFLICTAIEYARIKLFAALRIRNLIIWLENKCRNIVYKIWKNIEARCAKML